MNYKSLKQHIAENTAYVEGRVADYIDNLNRHVVGVGDFSDGVIAAFNQAAMHVRDGSYKDDEGVKRFLETAEANPIDVNFAEDPEQVRKDEIDDITNKGVDSFSERSMWCTVCKKHLFDCDEYLLEMTHAEIDAAGGVDAVVKAAADADSGFASFLALRMGAPKEEQVPEDEDPGAGLDFDAFGGEDNDELRMRAQEVDNLFDNNPLDDAWARIRQNLADSRMEGEALKENALAAAESDPAAVYGGNGQPKKVRQQMTFEGGKYTLLQYEDGTIEAHRYGKPWREFIGDKFIGVMAEELFVINQMFNR